MTKNGIKITQKRFIKKKIQEHRMRYFAVSLIAIMIFGVFSPAFGLAPLEKVIVTEPGLVNRSGTPIGTNVNVNQQVLVSSKITNAQEINQDFIFIVQIKDESGAVIKIGWITGSLTKYQNFTPAFSWIPTSQGTFSVEIYVWDGLDQKKHNYEALSEPIKFLVISS
ncbi:hypothetical protein NsoK4_03405 [Nitrosopumilus sp. K4]|uniref:hypothetical protein n=1 Tax=Nitrosopumilus sp. K4 TaxID=2795383 RepID=UPI001BA83776|nr:hypothetical protein [Nitrosopumilus sp. K4]QUC65306.1 hypothetical protein NsoK4_03405 [Nitrosopumilus sp. K4]